jgi:AcrR family transcriptional regulator
MAPEHRREQLLDVALELVNSGGVAAVSVDAVAKAAGVTRPVIYGLFEDANHVLCALLEREGERALAQIAAVLPTDFAATDPVETFTAVARGFFEAVQAAPPRWRSILLPVDGSPAPVRDYKERGASMLRDRFAQITLGFLAGRPGAECIDVELLAHLLLNAMETGGRLVLTDPDQFGPERLTRMAHFLADTLLCRYPAGSSGRAPRTQSDNAH